MKKTLSLILATLFIIGMISGKASAAGLDNSVVDVSEGIALEQKIYCNATLEDDFSDNEILVTVYPEWDDKTYTLNDFENIDCVSVEEIFDGERSDIPSRIILLTLDEASKENVLHSIEILEERSDIFCAEPNYLCEVATEPDDAEYIADKQWAIDKIALPDAWDVLTGCFVAGR